MSPDDRRSPGSSDPPPRPTGYEVRELKKQLDDLSKTLHALEVKESVHYEETKGKFNNGFESFESVRENITALGTRIATLENDAKPKRNGWLPLAGFVLPVLLVIASIVNTASTYVDRPTLERTSDKIEAAHTELRDEVFSMRNQVTRLEAQLVNEAAARATLQGIFERVLSNLVGNSGKRKQ